MFALTKLKKGFTLIELLVVISIIAILAGFGTARYLTAEKQTRDTQRKSDLTQYRLALENYASASNTLYPAVCGNVSTLCSFGGTPSFQTTYLAGACLQDPRASASVYYHYCSNGSQYALWAVLESGGYYEVCSNGRSGKLTTQPTDTGGACSLL
jgi:prepilin-type N-terminal cleavage/methylation domain-containing protein